MENLTLAEDVLTRLEAGRAAVNMGIWVKLDARTGDGRCGTVACIAGHILIAAGYVPIPGDMGGDWFRAPDGLRVVRSVNIPSEAEEVIGFTEEELYDNPDDEEDDGDLFLMWDADEAIARFRHLVEEERRRRSTALREPPFGC